MNLAKLLAAGKSFVAAREGAHRYRLNRVSLPKFISPRNPFAPPERTDAAPVRVESPAEHSAAPSNETADESPRQQSPERPAQRAELTGRLVARVKRWSQELKQVFSSRSLRTKPARRAPAVAPVQRELSLDQIRVVRNDLRDEDIEVVLVGPAQGAGAKAVSAARWGVVGRAWERLSSRFSTVNQT